ncbi:unnamed protein product [Heligmosomoides polygyrus]|uniref:PL48 domain-containing protein n=1 Tax=Heligmosomoides polygyrus TaxID=6339 RepID=A0A3P8EBT3_HELPZ|nr:unnamed protein product [Heligmosomoides polygyrus]
MSSGDERDLGSMDTSETAVPEDEHATQQHAEAVNPVVDETMTQVLRNLISDISTKLENLRQQASKRRTVFRKVAMYGVECWLATKEVVARLNLMETKMLHWTAVAARLDRTRNDEIRESHVLRASDDTVRKISLNIEVKRKMPKDGLGNAGLIHCTWTRRKLVSTPTTYLVVRSGVSIPEERTPPRSGPNAEEEE